jgi:sugar/nucleoside kinase (ribokinase family)
MSERAVDLLIAGELNPDAIVLAGAIEPQYGQVERLVDAGALTIGSSGAIVACGAARLGMSVAYVGVVGDDASGRFMLRELRRRGVDVDRSRVDPERATGLSVVLSSGDDRAILTSLGAMTSLTANDVSDEMLASAKHLHISSPHLQARLREGLAGLFTRAREAGASTSLDPGWDPAGSWAGGLEGVLDATDVFLPNAAEACRFADSDDPQAALEILAARIETVAVKLGDKGAIAARGGQTVKAEAGAIEVVDSTGAGDSFTAGFLRALGSGGSLAEALRLGVACGSLSTRGIGGVEAQPSLDEALALAAEVSCREIERSGR